MRRAQKKQAREFIKLLGQAHEEIKRAIEKQNRNVSLELLQQCQEGAIELGSLIEKTEGEDFETIPLLEDYCEQIYQIHQEIAQGQPVAGNKVNKTLNRLLVPIKNSINNNIKTRLEVVFFPYKAAMWDSLESIWMAADADPDCDAYVVPIPYYDKNPDGSFRKMHYEGLDFPGYVPIQHYDSYKIEERQPDVVYIHNPYDQGNYVTSVDPRFYSVELKKYTDCLVYVPYYITSGGMTEGQRRCFAYNNVDYIIIQAEKYRKYLDPSLPKEKVQPLGSPKLDRVIRLCNNPPEPPEAWKGKMTGKKVYFYNTSINGMLGGTEQFLKKMEYVFQCFEGREDACLVWRPHPLLESTLDSMRSHLRPEYDRIKQKFMEGGWGIYDDTSDIESTIALCDAYIGDSATSVTALFGMSGKPLFILNNQINSAPGEDDWRGEIIKGFFVDRQDKYMVTQGNKLYYSPNEDYCYEFCCDLNEYAYGNYYSRAIEIGGKVYVCPANAQEILVVEGKEIKKRVLLKRELEDMGAFVEAWSIGTYLFLVPFRYPTIVRYDTMRNKVDYIEGYNEVFVRQVNGEWRVGGSCVWRNFLLLSSPSNNQVVVVDSKTCGVQTLALDVKNRGGCMVMAAEEDRDVWLLPYTGTTVTRWNPENGELREYSGVPSDFRCKNRPHGYECKDRPFWMIAFCGDQVYLSPYWGNMFLCLNKESGEIWEWKPPFPVPEEVKNGYFNSGAIGRFLYPTNTLGQGTYRYFSLNDCRLYDVNLETEEYREVPVSFQIEELRNHEPGFWEESNWLPYVCIENSFNSLERFLSGEILGASFDRERQLKAFGLNAANCDGTTGENVHRFVCEKMK